MTKSAVAYWVAQFNQSQANLATRTSERDSARNSLYVSGAYLSGATWQAQDATDLANYNAEVALYNAMVTDRDLWTGRANNAWGASRVWNSGASFESRLPPALDHLAASGASARQNFAFGLQTAATITFDRTGQWIVVAYNNMTDTSFGLDVHGKTHLIVNGSDVASSDMSLGNGSWTTPGLRVVWQGSANNGQTASVQIANEDGSGGARNATGYIDAYFIPTATNPN